MSKIKEQINLVGTAGEFFVCAELCRRGYLALMTPKNNPLFDIVVTTLDGRHSVSIQVKTRSIHNKQGWKMGKGITINKDNPNYFVVLVNLVKEGLPQFYIYEYDRLAEIVHRNYENYISKPKRDGNKRKPVDFRWHDEKNFTSEDTKRLGNWEPIINALKRDE